jgi:hypothetical protein
LINKYITIIAITLFSISSCTNEIVIEPIKVLDTITYQTFNGKIIGDKIVNYKISGYKNNEKTTKVVEAFLNKHLDPQLRHYNTYTVRFFKAVNDDDKIMLRHRPDRFYNLENLIFEFDWIKGKLVSKKKYRDGESLDAPPDITINPAARPN